MFGINLEAMGAAYQAAYSKRRLAELEGPCEHVLFKDGDLDIPFPLLDNNGQVALEMCKICGKVEGDL